MTTFYFKCFLLTVAMDGLGFVDVFWWSWVRISNLIQSNVWLTVHHNSVWIRNQLGVTFVLSFISPLQVAQHVSGNHVPIIRS